MLDDLLVEYISSSILSSFAKISGSKKETKRVMRKNKLNPLKDICVQVGIQLYAYAMYKLYPLPFK